MLEQWVIDKLSPLKGEKLIILADPQRMIRAGAQSADGWAKDNGFTLLFCSGNLALREMYENLRGDTSAKGRELGVVITFDMPSRATSVGRSPGTMPANI